MSPFHIVADAYLKECNPRVVLFYTYGTTRLLDLRWYDAGCISKTRSPKY